LVLKSYLQCLNINNKDVLGIVLPKELLNSTKHIVKFIQNFGWGYSCTVLNKNQNPLRISKGLQLQNKENRTKTFLKMYNTRTIARKPSEPNHGPNSKYLIPVLDSYLHRKEK
jgi:hypothetical protein